MSTMQFTGFVGSQPEKKSVKGSSLLSVSVAYSTGRDEPTVWIEVACWGPMGERLADTVKKGDFVFCTGTIRKVSAYQKKNGDIGQSIQMTGSYCRVLEKGAGGGSSNGGGGGSKPPSSNGGGWGGGSNSNSNSGGWGGGSNNNNNGNDGIPF